MTPREARHAIYAAALAIDTYIHPEYQFHEDVLDALDEVLDEIRIAEVAVAA